MTAPRRLPSSPVLRRLRGACLDERWEGMPFTIADQDDETRAVLANTTLTAEQVKELVKRAVTSVRLTLPRIKLPEHDMLTTLTHTYHCQAKHWDDLGELLWMVERMQYWLQGAARMDTDAALLDAGVNPNAVNNRTYDPATAYADLHIASHYLDDLVYNLAPTGATNEHTN